MKLRWLRTWSLPFLFALMLDACGVKGPPLPPEAESTPLPRPTPTSSPHR